jgi:hypothetical protein
LQSWLSAWEAEISEARPQPITAPDILRDGAIYLERLQDQARRWLTGYLSLILEGNLQKTILYLILLIF